MKCVTPHAGHLRRAHPSSESAARRKTDPAQLQTADCSDETISRIAVGRVFAQVLSDIVHVVTGPGFFASLDHHTGL
jgi:hypothetical protein